MGLFELIIVLVVVGVILWLVNTYIPMDGNIKKILNVAVCIVVVLWLLSLFVGFPGFHDVPITRVH